MLKNFIVVAIRHLWRSKVYAVINILGLSIGLAATILLFLFIFHELSYDHFHEKKDRIYRVHYITEKDGAFTKSAITTAAIGPSMARELPEVENMMRFSYPRNGYFTYKNKNIHIGGITYIDSSFYKMFDASLIEGNIELALDEPFTVVLTESAVRKIFGEEDPVGKIISYNNEEPLKVTGVMRDFPSNSHMQFNALISFVSLYHKDNMYLDWNGGHNYFTYVLLKKSTEAQQLKERFPGFLEKHINYLYRQYGVIMHMDLLPLTKIHLHSGVAHDIYTKGSLTNIIIYTTIALFILVIACINYMNLATARAIRRSREVGIRKVVGANRSLIIRQFISESILVVLISLLISLLLIEIFQPEFNMLIGKTLNLYSPSNMWIILAMVGLTVMIGILAGTYPAFYVSRFQPVDVVKGSFISFKGKPIIRNILVVIQFFISASLIICTLVIFRQLDYIKNKDLGYDPRNILIINFPSENSKNNYDVLMNEINKIPGVEKIAAASGIPGYGFTSNGYIPEGQTKSMMFHALFADDNYLDLLNIPVVQGRMYDRELTDDREAYLVNETLVKLLDWEDPIGKVINRNGPHRIIGVVKDFHYAPLHHNIEPLIITIRNPDYYYSLALKFNPESYTRVKELAGKVWRKINPDEPFISYTLEDHLDNVYRDESHFGKVFFNFSVLAIFIACMGLLGLAAFTLEQRKKEVGIRKVLGASFNRLLIYLSLDFVKWVILANILAAPAAYYFMNRWLEQFAFTQPMGPVPFLITLLFTIFISWITILMLVLKVSRSNPSDVLKYE